MNNSNDTKNSSSQPSSLNLVSAVVPIYNRADLITATLNSILNQVYRPIEIVIVDDGSTDNTEEVIKAWADQNQEDSQLNLRYVQQQNLGGNTARNRGIQEAQGDTIAFLDSDDCWLPNKLEMQISILKGNADVGGVYCGMVNVNLETGEREAPEPRAYPQGNLLRDLLIHDVTDATSCWVVRKECFAKVGTFDTELPARQDWDMWIRLSEKYQIGCVPEILVEMGNHHGERVRSKAEREISAHQVIFHKYAHFRARFPLWVSLAARSAMYRRRGRVYFHRGISWPKAMMMQIMAIVVWPFNFDSYAALAGIFLPKELRKSIRVVWNRVFGKTRLAIKTH